MKQKKRIYVLGKLLGVISLIFTIVFYMFNPGSLVKTKQEVRREILTIDTEELSDDLSDGQRAITDKLVEIITLENKRERTLNFYLTDIENQLLNDELSTYQTHIQ